MDPERRKELHETLRRAGIDEQRLSDEERERVVHRMVAQLGESVPPTEPA